LAPIWRSRSSQRSQGLLAPEILVTKVEHRDGDPDVLPDAVIRFCNWCVEEAWLVRDEVQPDAWLIYHSNYYVAQVNNGGHGQFAGNSRMKPDVLDDVEAGLDRLGLDDLLAVFRRFRGALAADSKLKQAAMEGYGFGDIPDAIREVDDAFFASADPGRFHREAARWLQEAPTVLPLTPREIRVRQEAIVAGNKLLSLRRAEASRRPPLAAVKDVAARLWDKTGLQRPGETVVDMARRRVAARPDWAREVHDIYSRLISEVYPAVHNEDHEGLDEIFAGFRDLHARYRIEETARWPDHIRMYASKLHYAGQRVGRSDLLEQAADAFGRSIATGQAYQWDPGFDWRSLGEALVDLARLDETYVPGVREALDAYAQARTIDSTQADKLYYVAFDLVGRAEAHLVLSANGADAGHLDAAREALAEARPLLRPSDRNRWGVVNAELLSLLPPAGIRARERAQAVRALDAAIAWEAENEGGDSANPMRLKRLRQLRERFPPA
jgi:hypothetical protein